MVRGNDSESQQQQIIDLERGLFWIRYLSAEDEIAPPRVEISAAPGHERSVELILHPDADEAVLWEPGSALIARVAHRAQLKIAVTADHRDGSRAASVKVEAINQGTPSYPSSSPSAGYGQAGIGELELLGHVAGRGDVVVGSNEWIAGPTAPGRIEGLSLAWDDKPNDVELRYAVKSPGQTGTPKLVRLDAFAGTRGRAQPITGVVLEMSGPGAARYQFVVEGLFLSSPTLRAVGQKVVLAGPTGREPLVGLRIEIQTTDTDIFDEPPPRRAGQAPARRAAANYAADTAPADLPKPASSSRVRVFRSKPKQDASSD